MYSMKKQGIITLIIALTPVVASADVQVSGFPFSDVDTYVSGIISQTQNAASSSGGSDSSASVQTSVTSGSGGTTYHAEIRTQSNGTMHIESVDKTLPPGARVDIRLGTSTGGEKIHVQTRLGGAPNAPRPLLWFAASTTSPSLFDSVGIGSDAFLGGFWERLKSFFNIF